jgi:uncharacterized membrane protein
MVSGKQRLTSIDTQRGLVIVIMALDHVRVMVAYPALVLLDFSDAEPGLFFTRWITHLCAPTFILLAGISAFLYGSKDRDRKDVSRFLLSRGIWLVFVELIIVNMAWNFNLSANFVPVLQVIWAIGVSMICLAGALWLPRAWIVSIAIVLIAGHNLLDLIQPAVEVASAGWLLLHIQGLLSIGGTPVIFVVYPLIPWVGVMMLGYSLGPYFAISDNSRPLKLILAGVILVLAFLVLRAANLYGDPNPWQMQGSLQATLIDFLNTSKYPPSLLFLLMTLGPALTLLGVLERSRGPLIDALVTMGRVPFFFYIAHLYLIHTVAIGIGLAQGFAISDVAVHFVYNPKTFGVGLFTVYILWVLIILALYPACRWFAGIKSRRRDWWLSYL